MSLNRKICYLEQPTPLQCGQAVLAMATGLPMTEILQRCGTDRETTLADMKRVLAECGIVCDAVRSEATDREDLPDCALLSLETPKCWHWSFFCGGTFYDPEYGVQADFPVSARKYYWELRPGN